MKVAVLVNEEGRAADPQGPGLLRVYERDGENWVASRQMSYSCRGCSSMAALRTYLATVNDWLGDCRVLAARPGNGYIRVTFGNLGVALWSVRGTPEQFVEQIVDFYADSAAKPAGGAAEDPVAPIEPDPERAGHYRVDLRQAMAQKGVHNSRRVLLPFLREASFERLDIICDHVPRWFEYELPGLGMGSTVESQSDFTRVHVYPKVLPRPGRSSALGPTGRTTQTSESGRIPTSGP